ncbi:hypothetical protein G7062_03685 [Erysipelothrix sp. HDW6C]|uniref:hypothetical protein n=1 Tax=Erysipelothrix sp. HDW6C TaxID=2714930 RepID=UPI001409FA40|nr:hypothetical protein [Erysipelothrix sp. HDW6C]QIK69447.1 hypothetical protein G7062_03685 [Erysipelothrix sp. HDW6C]
MTKKKIVKADTPETAEKAVKVSKVVEDNVEKTTESAAEKPAAKVFKPTDENKKKATQFRIIAGILWAIAIGLEIFAIMQLRKTPINLGLIIGLLIVDAIFAIGGSLLWKQANRLDPASEKDKVRFFVQNQLGFIVGIIAFLPLIVLMLTNKDMDGKQKGIATTVAVIALAIVSAFGLDFNPASIEKYTEETALVESLMGDDAVFWTKSGRVYHLFDDCYTINSDRTDEIITGKVSQAYELRNIEEICKICLKRAQAGTTAHVEDGGHDHHH